MAMLLLNSLWLRTSVGWPCPNLLAMLRELYAYRDQFAWLSQPFELPAPLEMATLQLSLAVAIRA